MSANEIPNWKRIPCPDCDDGMGLREGLSADDAICTAQAGLFNPCEVCDGEESHRCEVCEGDGYRELASDSPIMLALEQTRGILAAIRAEILAQSASERASLWYDSADVALLEARKSHLWNLAHPDCETCDGQGTIPCAECEGTGGDYYSCGVCDEPIDSDSYSEVCYIADGEIVCEDCSRVDCETCEGEQVIALEEIKLDGTSYAPVAASCSCCGAKPRAPGEQAGPSIGLWDSPAPDWGWYVFRAQMSDTDRVFYSYLCGDETGEEGCLRAVIDQQDDIAESDAEALEILRDCAGTDDDGLWGDVSDFLGMHSV